MSPKVSVIITTYRNPAVLPRSIGSVIAQTFREWELIVVYDGPADDETKKIIAGYAAKDSRIKPLIEIAHCGGPARPRNAGVGVARGEYVAILDDDDEWLPEKLEKQLRVYEVHPRRERLGLVGCDLINVYEDGTEKIHAMPKERIKERVLLFDFNLQMSTILCPGRVLRDINGFNETLPPAGGGGFDVFVRLVKKYDVSFAYAPLVKRYFLPNRLSKHATLATENRRLKLWELFRTYELNDDIYRAYPKIGSRLWRDLGMRYARLLGDRAKAKDCMRRAIALRPMDFKSRLRLLFLTLR